MLLPITNSTIIFFIDIFINFVIFQSKIHLFGKNAFETHRDVNEMNDKECDKRDKQSQSKNAF